MNRSGSAAVILVALAVVIGGGYYISEHPGLIENLDSDLPGSGDGSDTCTKAIDWASNNGYTPEGCACAEIAGPDDFQVPTALLDLGDGRYLMVGKQDGTWRASSQPVALTDNEVQQACNDLAES